MKIKVVTHPKILLITKLIFQALFINYLFLQSAINDRIALLRNLKPGTEYTVFVYSRSNDGTKVSRNASMLAISTNESRK